MRCGDRACSVDGSCPLSSPPREVALNSPPQLRLLSVPAADDRGVVRVPRGWLYAVCEPGTPGTVSEPCESGAILLASAEHVQIVMFRLLSTCLTTTVAEMLGGQLDFRPGSIETLGSLLMVSCDRLFRSFQPLQQWLPCNSDSALSESCPCL
jgi:hypothetical protein